SPKSPYPNRSSGSLSNSDRSTRSTTKYINILEHNNNLPPMPLGMSDNVEYFSKAALGMSPSSGYVIQSRDSKPTGIFFHPNPRSTIPRVPSVGHPMERDRGQSLSTISHLPSRSATGDMSPMSFSSLHSAVITPRAMTRKISSSAVPLAKSRMEPSTTIPGVSTAIPSPNISFAQAHPAVRNVRTPSVSRTPVKGNAVEANSVPKVSVLIVDDNPINQSILSTFMRKKKIKYAVASDGAEAVEKWRTGEFHLILMDIQMPIMDGIKAAIEIRRLEKSNASAGNPPLTDSGSPMQTPSKLPDRMAPDRSSVIIVALTTTSSDRVAALAAGCNDFLTKPVSLLWLNNKITEWGSIKMLQMWADPGPEPAQT
ncbi:CheY-like superfamily, partial [Mycena floridula]